MSTRVEEVAARVAREAKARDRLEARREAREERAGMQIASVNGHDVREEPSIRQPIDWQRIEDNPPG
jgi:hypothetical protein